MEKKIVVIAAALCFIFLSLAQAQTKDASEDLLKNFQQATDSMMSANHNARFTCPRYLLRWGMELYKVGAKEEAIRIAEAAKRISEISARQISKFTTEFDTRYPQELKDPAIKQKMISYLQAVSSAAEEHVKYFKTGDKKVIDAIDKYLDEAAKYNKDIEAMLRAPILTGQGVVGEARYMCPRWLTTFAEGYSSDVAGAIGEERGYYKSVAACEDCAEIVKSAKTINEVFAKEIAGIKDATLKGKYLAYINALQEMNDAFIKFYTTGDKNLADAPYKYQEKALQLSKELDDYIASMQKQQ